MTSARPRTIATAALGMAASLLLAACGSSSAPAANASKPAAHDTDASTAAAAPSATPVAATKAGTSSAAEACGLVTRKDASAALGTDLGAGKPLSSHGSTQCQYGTFATQLVLVNLTPSRGKVAYDVAHSNPKVGRPTDVAGVGDRAFEVTRPHTASIYFNQGDAIVFVMVVILKATSPPTDQALALAKTAAGRT